VEDHPLDYGDFEGTIPKGQYGGGTVMLWDRGYWAPEGSAGAEAMLRKGDLKFVAAGEKMQGSWVLVRMKTRDEKRNNWLLIKHRDGFERDGDGDALTKLDRSVASGRTMDQIAAGKGPGPKPFMRKSRKAAKADDVWHSNRSEREIPERTAPPPAKAKPLPRGAARMPEFVEPQLCTVCERAPSGAQWVHEIKFDGYRLQLRVVGGKARLRTRKGLDWTEKFAAIAKVASKLPDCIIDGEVVALDREGRTGFRCAAGRTLRRQKRSSHLFCLRCALSRRRRSAPSTAGDAQGATRNAPRQRGARTGSLRRTLPRRRDRRFSIPPAGWDSKGSSPSGSPNRTNRAAPDSG